MKRELDEQLSVKFSITPEDIRPWHYIDPFFQEAPPSELTNTDFFYKGKDFRAYYRYVQINGYRN